MDFGHCLYTDITMAWCGPDFTIVRAGPVSNSTLMCFGKAKLGYCTELPAAEQQKECLRTPQAIPRPGFEWRRDAVQVAFGANHWAVVSAGGGLFTAGDNSWGQLGRGSYADKCIQPLQNVFWSRVSSVACGEKHTLIVYTSLTMGGQQVWGCGSNLQHQLSVESWPSKSEFFSLNISKMTRAAGCDVPESAGSACQPGSILRIAAGSQFSVVSVNDVVGMIGTGYPRPSTSEPGPRYVEFRIPAESAAALPWHGSPIKHLVAGIQHVLIGCVCDKRLRVWGWGSNHFRQLGFRGWGRVFVEPTEIVYACPQQPSDAFPSMLAASDSSSMIMVNGQVWAMGQHECENFEPTPSDSTFFYSTVMHVKAIDPQFFDNLPIAYVGTGPRHAAFVTTCGRVYVRGFCSWRGEHQPVPPCNSLPTRIRRTKRGVVGVCEKRPLAHPRLMPSELFGGLACGLVCEPLARKLAFLMGSHARLRVKDGAARGGGAGFDMASLDSLLLKLILDVCDALHPALVRP